MVFADIGDRLELSPASEWCFEVVGETAGAIGEGENLVDKAARLLFDRVSVAPPPLRLRLHKSLPVAAGLGGGSSDAGAALRLLNRLLPQPAPQRSLEAVAAELGADGLACLRARPVLATGLGELLAPAPDAPPLPAVLVNPGRPSPTGAVYRAYDAGPVQEADAPPLPARFESVRGVVDALATWRNDLEPPALALEPAIGEVLALLAGQPEVLLARMSGSGATCFALCAGEVDARALEQRLRAQHPRWWVRACTLGSPATGGSRTRDGGQPRRSGAA